MAVIKGKTKEAIGKVGILMGGPSSEREISLKSGQAVYVSLKNKGLDVVPIDIKTAGVKDNIRLLAKHKLGCAFLALHGYFGEDGQIQAILDSLKIPYTGSPVTASKLAMDKIASRHIFKVYGLDVPRYKALDKFSYNRNWNAWLGLQLPLVIKPASGGSSIGLSMVDRKEDIGKAVRLAFKFDKKVLAEEHIKGRELTVGILDDSALPVIEIIPKKRFFDFQAKYQVGMAEYKVPAELDKDAAYKVQRVVLAAHRLLGCFGCSRVDIILDRQNRPFILEVNTIPGLTETSLLPKAARNAGLSFGRLCVKLIEGAYKKIASR